jgi:hypothetical protein
MGVLDDKDAIREVLHRYCFCMDEGRFVELSELFDTEGEWIAPYRQERGPADIAAWLAQSVPAVPKRMHYAMNSIIAVSIDTATAKSNYLVVVDGPAGPEASVCGTYADNLVRTVEGWKFKRRELIHSFKGQMRLTLP